MQSNLFKFSRLLFLTVWMFSLLSLAKAQVTSTSAGGNWSDPATWLGNTVPDPAADVVINGPVKVNNGAERVCRNLTINSGITLENAGLATLRVSNRLNNKGSLLNQDGWTFYLKVGNEAQNDGLIEGFGMQFSFEGAGPTIIGGSGWYNMSKFEKTVNGQIVASSPLRFGPNCGARLTNDTLVMGAHKLTINSTGSQYFASSGFTGGNPDGYIQSNGEVDVSGRIRMNLLGSPTLVGNTPMDIVNAINCDELTIAEGKILRNSGIATLRVKSRLTNRGRIEDLDNWTFYIEVADEIINIGSIESSVINLTFTGSGPASISGSGIYNMKGFEKSVNGRIVASSPLRFGPNCGARLTNDTLVMGAHKLTINSTGSQYFASSGFTGGNPDGYIQSNGEVDVSGRIRMNLLGSPTLVGNTPMDIVNAINCDELTIAEGKILRNSGIATLRVKSRLTNRGRIEDQDNWMFYIEVAYEIVNTGSIESSEINLTFTGLGTASISGSGLYNMKGFEKSVDGRIVANSPLRFGSNCGARLTNDTLVMGTHMLTINSNGTQYFSGNGYTAGYPDAFIDSHGEVDISGRFRMSFLGHPNLVGTDTLFLVVVIRCDSLTIGESQTLSNSGIAKLQINGPLYNKGLITSSGGWNLNLEAYGDLQNDGQMRLVDNGAFGGIVFFTSEKKIKWSGTGSYDILRVEINETGRLTIVDSVAVAGYIRISDESTLEIGNKGVLFLKGQDVRGNGRFINNGKLMTRVPLKANSKTGLAGIFGIQINTTNIGNADSLTVIQHGNTNYPGTGSGTLRQWWELISTPPLQNYYANLTYPHSVAAGLEEHRLMVFSGTNESDLKLISNPVNMTRDTSSNTIALGNAQNRIDEPLTNLVLSTGRIGVLPDVGIALSGPKDIRVGPQNRYTITYWNNNDFATGPLTIGFQTEGGVHLHSVLTTNERSGETIVLTRDSLGLYEQDDNYVLLTTQSLLPGEIRHFELRMTAVAGAKVQVLPLAAYWVIAGIVGYASVKVGEYVLAAQVENCTEWLKWYEGQDEATQKKLWDIFSESMQKKADGWESDLREGAAIKTFEILARGSLPAADVVVASHKCFWKMMGSLIHDCSQRQPNKSNKTAEEQDEIARFLAEVGTQPITCKSIDLNKITSWDPNEKYGPAGANTGKGHIREGEPLTYRIAFENVDTASAPAWRVIVLDTLDAKKVDINTVQFTGMSHTMGVASREGNILRWEFVDIELPPNQNPPEGEGWVEFTVRPKANLPQSTEFRNRASITFDLNRPMLTNMVINTLDKIHPATMPVGAYRIKGDDKQVDVVWEATDLGSGVGETYVYVQIDSLPLRLIGVSDSASARIYFNPYETRPFRIYVQSEDRVGNIEPQNELPIVEIKEPVSRNPSQQAGIERSLQVWPNPAAEVLNFRLENTTSTSYSTELLDLTGRVILTQSDMLNRGWQSGALRVGEVPRGVYLLQLQVGTERAVRRVILN